MLIYVIRNLVNEKVYLGKTTRSVQARWSGHLKEARAGSNRALCAAIRKYGAESFALSVWICALASADLDSLEKEAIRLFDSTNPRLGYNQTIGGEGSNGFQGRKHSAATKKLISEKLTGRKTGRRPSWTEESRKKLSLSMAGNKNGNQHIKRDPSCRRPPQSKQRNAVSREDHNLKIGISVRKKFSQLRADSKDGFTFHMPADAIEKIKRSVESQRRGPRGNYI